jgi:hypothetical protein
LGELRKITGTDNFIQTNPSQSSFNALRSQAGDNTGKIEWSRREPIGTDPTRVSVFLPDLTSGTVDVSTRSDSGSFEKLLKMRNCSTIEWDKLKTNGPVTYAMIRPTPGKAMVSEISLSKMSRPSSFILMTEALATATGTLSRVGEVSTHLRPLTQKEPNLRHNHATINALMGDISVRTMTWKEIEKGISSWTTY